MKQCFKCGKWKALDEFYRHPEMADGYLGKCKECTKKDNTENRKRNVEYYRSYDRRRFRNPKRRACVYRRNKQHRLDNPGKYAARTTVGNAIRDGRLTPQPCEHCGNIFVEAHHPDHSKPLEVIWLCKACHTAEHQRLKEINDEHVIAIW